jgi:ferredoxin-NADP reductase
MDKEFFNVVVQSVDRQSDHIVSLTLEHPLGQDLTRWHPGAHVDVQLPNGLVRQYSLCSDPEDGRSWRIAVFREPDGRGASAYVHDELKQGTKLQVRAPRNNFPMCPAERYLFIAGGIGITPIISMVRSAAQQDVPWDLVYLGRNQNSMAFLSEINTFGDNARVHTSQDSGPYPLNDLVCQLAPGTAVYACGPQKLLDVLEEASQGWADPSAHHCERFSRDPGGIAAVLPNSSFVVELGDGTEVPVPPELSILEALESVGVNPVNSCREGICGTCETPVLAGEIDHRDTLLSPAEREAGTTMMICVSRCRGTRLVLDL